MHSYYNTTSSSTTKADDSFNLDLREHQLDFHLEILLLQSILSISGRHYQFHDCFYSTLHHHVIYDPINKELSISGHYFNDHLSYSRISCDPKHNN